MFFTRKKERELFERELELPKEKSLAEIATEHIAGVRVFVNCAERKQSFAGVQKNVGTSFGVINTMETELL